jgi:hypothetical protein
MSATYTKLKSGEWGLRIEGTAKPGETVTVRKKSGEQETRTVGKVVWSGNGISLCTVAGAPAARPGSRRPRSRGGEVCQECGKPGRLVTDLEDGMRKHYGCCDIPPGGY